MRLRLAIVSAALGLLAAAGCTKDPAAGLPEAGVPAEGRSSASADPVAEPIPEAPPDMVSDACMTEIGDADSAGRSAIDKARRIEQGMNRARKIADGAVANARAAQAEADARNQEATSAQSSYEAALAEYDDFIDAFGTTLREPLYSEAVRLGDAADARRAEANEAIDTYNRAASTANKANRAANAKIRIYNRKLKALNAADKQIRARRDTYDGAVDKCLADSSESWNEAVAAIESRLAEAGLAIAPGLTGVRCDSPGEWRETEAESPGSKYELEGYVNEGESSMHLGPAVCFELHRALIEGELAGVDCAGDSLRADAPLCGPSTAGVIASLETVAHEAIHVTGVGNEARATCLGVQALPGLGVSELGVTLADGRRMARYLLRFYEKPREYRTKQCRPGGKLDQSPETPWP